MNICRQLIQYEKGDECCRQFDRLMDDCDLSNPSPDLQKALVDYLNTRALLRLHQGRSHESLTDLQQALDWLISLSSDRPCIKDFVVVYINFYNVHMILGNATKAQEYLVLSYAKMKAMDKPNAYGLSLFLENLACYKLFVAGSQREAIDAMGRISEEVVLNFNDIRRDFDFFSSIIVQLHEGKIDVEEIREQIKSYGDDPLIKAYVPTLLYGAPPPGSAETDDFIPPASLVD